MKYILSVLVENKPGVLSRVTGLISRRGFNIDSLTVAPTEDVTMSRMTIIVNADEVAYEQLTKQLHKLVSVYKISDLTEEDAIERELVLFKVVAPPDRRHEIIEIANIFRANIVDVGKNSLTVEATGTASKLDAMEGPLPKLRHPPAHADGQDRDEPRCARRLGASGDCRAVPRHPLRTVPDSRGGATGASGSWRNLRLSRHRSAANASHVPAGCSVGLCRIRAVTIQDSVL